MVTQGAVFIVDDEPGVRKALRVVVEAAGLRAQTFESAEDFLQRGLADSPGCLLLDLRLRGISGLQLLDQLQKRNSPLHTLMISGHGDIRTAVETMKLGAVDFLEKPLVHSMLVEKIREALAKIEAKSREEETGSREKDRLSGVTPREREITRMLIAGKSSKQIAAELGLSYRTVCNHRANLLAKTGAENTADLVRMALTAGFNMPAKDK
jgi:FixJ family two-component response regulator